MGVIMYICTIYDQANGDVIQEFFTKHNNPATVFERVMECGPNAAVLFSAAKDGNGKVKSIHAADQKMHVAGGRRVTRPTPLPKPKRPLSAKEALVAFIDYLDGQGIVSKKDIPEDVLGAAQ